MKKGFTLIELLAVIAILAVISVITFPVVNNLIKGANQHAYDENIEVIKKAAYDWTLLNTSLLPENENESIIVYLGELKLSGSIDKNIKNPLTGKFLSNNTSVVVTKNGNEYVYEVNVVDLNGNNNDKTPLLVISGNIVDYVEVTQENVTYTVPSATAKTGDGYPISSSYISYQIFKDDIEVGSVDVSSLGMYTIKYSVTYDGETGIYEKKVVVRDTIKPVLNIGDSIFASIDALPSNEDLLTDVTVTDNSGEVIVPTVRSEIENREGIYYVYYDATDSSGNSITKRKEVIVNVSGSGNTTSFEYKFSNYNKLEYIESHGTEYILTAAVPDNSYGLAINVRITNTSNTSNTLVGAMGDGNTRFYIGFQNSKLFYGWNNWIEKNDYDVVPLCSDTCTLYLNYLNDRKFSINSTVIDSNLGTLSVSNTPAFSIFGNNCRGTVDSLGIYRLYNLKITSNDEVVNDYVPCVQKDDSTHVGVCDMVTGNFYGNSGSGSFTTGAL